MSERVTFSRHDRLGYQQALVNEIRSLNLVPGKSKVGIVWSESMDCIEHFDYFGFHLHPEKDNYYVSVRDSLGVRDTIFFDSIVSFCEGEGVKQN